MQRSVGAAWMLAALFLAASLGAAALPGNVDSPLALWTQTLGQGEPAGMAVDPFGETYVARGGEDSTTLWDLDPAGNVQWTVHLPGQPNALAAVPSGGVIVAGDFWGTTPDVVVQRVGLDGSVAWSRTIATPREDHAYAAAADSQAVYAVGSTGSDALIARLALDGSLLWVNRVATAVEDRAQAVTVLKDHSAVLAGWTYDGFRNRLLVAKVNPVGDVEWLRVVGGASGSSLRGYSITTTPVGNVLVAGLQSLGGRNVPMVASFDPNGGLLWLKTLDGQPGSYALSVASDLLGGPILAGGNGGGWFVAHLTPQGAVSWAGAIDAGGPGEARTLAWSPLGFFTLAGDAGGQVTAARFFDLPIRPA